MPLLVVFLPNVLFGIGLTLRRSLTALGFRSARRLIYSETEV